MKPLHSSPIFWKAWVFDLDDTLLDTSADLIPAARQRALSYLAKEGALVSVEQGEFLWGQWRTMASGPALFEKIVEAQITDPTLKSDYAFRAYQVFRSTPLPDPLNLRPGVTDLLKAISTLFPLFLVTQGDVEHQIKKIDKLKISHFFKHLYFIDPMKGEHKGMAFEEILRQTQFPPCHLLSIGNRLDTEIEASKIRGCKTCYVRYGEHSHERPKNKYQTPDFEIIEILELHQLIHFKEVNS